MMSCRNSSAVSPVRLSTGKLSWMPRSSSPPNGGLVRITSTRSRVADLAEAEAQRVASESICGASSPCSTRFICASRYGSGLASPP